MKINEKDENDVLKMDAFNEANMFCQYFYIR